MTCAPSSRAAPASQWTQGLGVQQPKPVDGRQFEIEFLDPGVAAFAFTFG